MKTYPLLRRVNALVSAAIVILFVVHALLNGFQLIGVGSVTPWYLACALLVLVCVHAVAGIVLTVSTLRAQRSAGASYPGANKRFWAVRVSGLALIVLVAAHLAVFLNTGVVLRVSYFGGPQFAMHLLLVACVAVHMLCNLQPLLISLGVGAARERAADFAFVIALVLLVAVVAFAIYYVQWSVV